jgi:hypothetical protein
MDVMMDILNLIEEIGEKEEKITDLEFVSPIFFNEYVATRVSGLIYKFTINKVDPGWYRIKPVDTKTAKVTGEADFIEKENYLKNLGKIRMTLVLKRKDVYMGIPDKGNKYGFPVEDLLPVYLHDDTVLDFDRVIARFDGTNLWFESVDINNDPSKADYLRESLEKNIFPSSIKFNGLSLEEKISYLLRHTMEKQLKIERKEFSIKEDVEHAGGQFIRYIERSDHYSVTYMVDGEEYTSHISKNVDRKVISAGICLNGGDNAFDLKSLITVIREGQDRDLIYRFNI